MTHSDPIADMLTRIRNALMVGRESVTAPTSKMKVAIAKILKEEGFISDYELVQSPPQDQLRVHLRYHDKNTPVINGLKRISKPGLRIYVEKREIPRFYGGRGLSIISTSKGLMTGQEAWRHGVGGELLCYVW
ncbi:MAG: 30S ribosomal protein S8 [Chloroflexi bacterium]|nr:30S ribosomal protein S8 [Chloroflexota bacterium]